MIFRDMGDGVYIQSRQNADLFTVAHFSTKTINTIVGGNKTLSQLWVK